MGIEVPNPERTMITLRELLESREFKNAKSKVTFAVGKDISGAGIGGWSKLCEIFHK